MRDGIRLSRNTSEIDMYTTLGLWHILCRPIIAVANS